MSEYVGVLFRTKYYVPGTTLVRKYPGSPRGVRGERGTDLDYKALAYSFHLFLPPRTVL